MRKLALIILDGWGLGELNEHNAIHAAKTPFFDHLWARYPHTQLQASGSYVGLPEGQIGGSEVGHLTIGAGRVIYQTLPRISVALNDPNGLQGVMNIPNFLKLIQSAKESPLHLIGMVSPGGVHSHEDHLYAILKILKAEGAQAPYIHLISDGRDVSPTSGTESAQRLIQFLRETEFGIVATVSGRFFAMDRDNNMDRTQKAVDVIRHGKTKGWQEIYHMSQDWAENLLHVFSASYEKGVTDEFIEPVVVDPNYIGIKPELELNDTVVPGDCVFFFNFRSDRMKQLITQISGAYKLNQIFTMTQYGKDYTFEVIFEKDVVVNTLSEVISKKGLTQLKAAETEKYPHVSYFFNGGVEVIFDGERRSLSESHKVRHDEIPEMKAADIADKVKISLDEHAADFILVNFANPDMVGHTGNFDAVVAGVETVDCELEKLCAYLTSKGYICVITADHGNADIMFDIATHTPHTAHTVNPVPFIVYDTQAENAKNLKLNQDPANGLDKIAGTVLELMQLDVPQNEQHFQSLIVSNAG